jgi:3-hydroxyacyl-CoA dehydrogenase
MNPDGIRTVGVLDVGLDVISYVHEELGDPYYMPPRILKELVRAGRLGQDRWGLLRVPRRF